MTKDLLLWILFNTFILVMLAFDLLIVHRKSRVISVKESCSWAVFWVALALIFNLYIYYTRGFHDALNFLTGYLIEKTLSLDNLFFFLLIFKYFQIKEIHLHKILFWGVLGAIITRALFIGFGIALISNFHWMIYIFGTFLVITGIKFAFEKEKQVDPNKNIILKIFRSFFPVAKTYKGGKFFIQEHGHYSATPLFIVLLAIETGDIVFALDSIPAILAITYDPFIVYTSNIFAILGLRSLYFALSHMITLFHYLHYGLSAILIFIGIKMLLAEIFTIPILLALGVVLMILFLSVGASIVFPNTKLEK